MENIKSILEKLETLKNISSTNAKKDFLKQNNSDNDFKMFLHYLLNPRFITGIDEAKINKPFTQMQHLVISSFKELFEYLSKNNTGKALDVAICNSFLVNAAKYYSLSEKEFSILKQIICKNYKIGVNVKLVNSVYGNNFIPVHEVQLGMSADNLKLKDDDIVVLTQKLNGTRGTYINGEILSRQGIPFTGLDHIIEPLNQYFSDYFIDGELIRKNIDGISDNENFRIGTGVLNSDNSDKSCIEFIVFDIVPVKEILLDKKSKDTYLQRRITLDWFSDLLNKRNIRSIRVVPELYCGKNPPIDTWLDRADSMGWEGLMLNKDVPYYCKRHNGLIKIKKFKHSDLKIIGFEEGSGKNKGMLGAFIVDYKGNSVNVGSGLTDLQRKEYWENRDSLIGKIIQVKYKEESYDKNTKKYSLQFPVFECLRFDKNEQSLE